MTKEFFFRLILLVFIVLFFVVGLSAQLLTTKVAAGETILVEIGDSFITTQELRQKINSLPAMQSPRFRTMSGQKQVLEMMITEGIFYKRAMELGIEELADVQRAIFISSQPIANEIYFNDLLSRELRFDPNSVEKYYNENISTYTVLPRVTIQHLQTNSDGLANVTAALNSDRDFLDIIEEHSTNPVSKGQKGMIRNIRLNGTIAGIGQDADLDVHIAEASLDMDTVHGPFETPTGIHFFKKIDFEPATVRAFSEVRGEIETRLRGLSEHELYMSHIALLTNKYNVVFLSDLLGSINVMNVPAEFRNSFIVQSSRPEINITFGEIEGIIRNSDARELQLDTTKPSVQEMLIKTEIDRRILNVASAEANIFELHKDNPKMQETRLRVILSYFNNTEIRNKVEVSREELLDFYENNTERYTTPASRSVRQFISTDERAARKHRSEIAKMLRRKQNDRIIDYVQKNSLNLQNGGLLEYIYRNNLIPHLGEDQAYNQKVFDTKIGQLSDIFRNVNNEVVFFFVVNETPPRVRDLHEVENSLMSIIHRQKAEVLFQELQEELKELYSVKAHFDRIVHDITPEELFEHAEMLQRMGQINEIIYFYDQIIKDFEGTDYAYRALFMKGFVASENLKDNSIAIQAFQELIEKFPEGDLNESAKFMLDALLSDVPVEELFGM